jgi:ornithine carbamoyltransferase
MPFAQAPVETPRAFAPAVIAQHHRDLISIQDLSSSEVLALINLAESMKSQPADFRGALDGKQLVLFFEKASLRTRLTFEAGVASMGGTSFFVDQTASRLGAREPLSDIAKNLERWVHGVVLRTFAHDTITAIAEHASIPVINALSDLEHPCQALADFMSLHERFGDLRNITLAYVGDGNNVAHSLILTAALTGASIKVATPAGYEPSSSIVDAAQHIATSTGATIIITSDPREAVDEANAVYTDVWASMGHESEASQRRKTFAPYQVNARLMSQAPEDAVFMHCLPAHRGEEVAAEVIDGPNSIVFDQAENRLHIQKAILFSLMGSGMYCFPARSA